MNEWWPESHNWQWNTIKHNEIQWNTREDESESEKWKTRVKELVKMRGEISI